MAEDLSLLPLLDLVPRLSPEFQPPWHLAEWVDLLERAANGEAVRGLCSMPIRHYKSETTFHGVIRILLRDPTTPIIYLTHSFEKAMGAGKRIRELARETTIGPRRGHDTITEWQNQEGGGVTIMSAEQSRLGHNCGCLIVDDPLDEHGADEHRVREAVDHAIVHYDARCMRKGKPGPVLLHMSRWHPNDPVGRRLIRTAREWTYVHRPAILDEGTENERAFAPRVWDLPQLVQVRAELRETDPTERLWWSQFMGEPRPTGSDLFGPNVFFAKFPGWGGYRFGFGVDMAFTAGEGSDWFARVAGRIYGQKLYLLDVTRHKIDAHLIESTCKADMAKWGTGPFFSYMSGPEVGMARVLNERGVPIQRMPARYNKLVRAQRTVKRWNGGDILVPAPEFFRDERGPNGENYGAGLWVPGFLHRVSYFRGNEKDSDDDEIDALVSLADGMLGGAAAGGAPKTLGRAYGGLITP